MDEKERNKLGLLGLIVGFIFGSGLNYLFLLLQNWLSQYWSVVKPVEVTFQSVLPLGIVMGLSMGAAMWSGMFGD